MQPTFNNLRDRDLDLAVWVAASRAAQDLPERVSDPATITNLRTLLKPETSKTPKAAA